jgi:hypothetical protein
LKTAHLTLSLALFFLSISISFVLSQEAPSEDKWQVYFSADGTTVSVDAWQAENLWMRKRAAAGQKSSDVWRFFMHAFRDHKARPLPWQKLFADDKEAAKWLDSEQSLSNPVKTSNFPVLLLDGQQMLVFPKPVLDIPQLSALRGRSIRFFVWIKGEDCGLERPLWNGAPTLTLSLKDSLDNLISTESSLFKTRGTFPWFCYYLEIEIPALLNTTVIEKKNVASEDSDDLQLDLMMALFDPALAAMPKLPDGGGLYLTINNLGSGKAWFSTLAWEIADQVNSLPKNQWADPVSGSRAPNPDYDELPMHLFFGIDPEKHWTFLKGNKNSPDLTTLKGLEEYFQLAAKDWFHLQYGVALLGYLNATGTVLKQTDDLEPGWHEALRNHIMALQNPTTGLWGAGGSDSLMVTLAIVNNCFNPKTLPRIDRPQEETPWLDIGAQGLPNSSALLNSLLAARLKDPASGKAKAWNRFAFQPEYLGAEQRDKTCDLGATSAAVQILAQIAAQSIINTDKEAALQAIQEAWEFAITNFVTPEFLWKQNDLSATVTSSAYMFPLFEATSWLEPKLNRQLLPPAIEAAEIPGDKYRLRWNDQKTSFASLRVYAAPEELPPEQLSERHLVAILNRSGRSPLTADPLFSLQTFAATAHKRWGITLESESAQYLAEKLAGIPSSLVIADGAEEVIFPIRKNLESEEPVTFKYYFNAVTNYGEMTAAKQILQ